MLICNQCKITIRGVFKRCPLCQGELHGTAGAGDDVFPVISEGLKPFRHIIRLALFLTIAAAVIAVAIDMAIQSSTRLGWSLFVIAGLASLWILFGIANKRWWNIPKSIILLLIFTSILEVAWDYLTGFYKWSFTFVIPIMFSASIIALTIFAVIRKLQPGDYLFILFIMSIVSVCSLLLIIFHLVSVIYPALICFVFSVISSSRIIIFEKKSLLKELRRRMHV
ncbi:MAG: DUF6320 domain-containing protein [Treponema sp.]|jgi:hypothetical protein|nr:DUF6320 domain-containing protein [Treponema sp.]